jgi:hypothetical protein
MNVTTNKQLIDHSSLQTTLPQNLVPYIQLIPFKLKEISMYRHKNPNNNKNSFLSLRILSAKMLIYLSFFDALPPRSDPKASRKEFSFSHSHCCLLTPPERDVP